MTHSFLFLEKKRKKLKEKTHPCERVLLHDITDGRNTRENISCNFQDHGSAIGCTQSSMATVGWELVDAELQAHPFYGT